MIKLDKLEKLGWDSLSFRAYIVRFEFIKNTKYMVKKIR